MTDNVKALPLIFVFPNKSKPMNPKKITSQKKAIASLIQNQMKLQKKTMYRIKADHDMNYTAMRGVLNANHYTIDSFLTLMEVLNFDFEINENEIKFIKK